MKPVHVLAGVDRFDHHIGVDVFRKGQLDQDAVDLGACVEPGDDLPEAILSRVRRQPVLPRQETGLRCGLLLAAHIDLRGGILADKDHGKAGNDTRFLLQFNSLRPHLGPHVLGDFAAVNHFGHCLLHPPIPGSFQHSNI